MTERTDGFDDDDEALIEVLANGVTYAEAGPLVNRSERTVRRRMTDEAFATAVAERRRERLGELTGRLTGVATDAVAVLEACLTDELTGYRIRAAQTVLNMALRYRSAADLEARVDATERRLDAMEEDQ